MSSCLIPGFDGALFTLEWRDALWAKFSTGAPTTTEAVRRAIQHSQESLRALAKRYGINQKTVRKWKARSSVEDLRTGPQAPRSTVLTIEEEAVIVAFRRHTLLPLDDCLYALQPTIPHLTRSSLHRCLQRHGISRLPEVEGGASPKRKFKSYPIGFFHIDIAEVRTAEGIHSDACTISAASCRPMPIQGSTPYESGQVSASSGENSAQVMATRIACSWKSGTPSVLPSTRSSSSGGPKSGCGFGKVTSSRLHRRRR